ncbi:MAG: MerR family transcriptional regulator [Epsilonproteobacteria bacterium]|nr:MerR family transcriptional regulator [Campylobacterota bacterium]
MKLKRKKGFFSISAVAKMFSVHQQTIRLYEKEGLIAPKRSAGNTRLFAEEDVDRLEEVIYLTHQLGINLAGVEMIFKLKQQIAKMQKDMNKMFDQTTAELDRETEQAKQLSQESVKRLSRLKKSLKADTKQTQASVPQAQDKDQEQQEENWAIEYDDFQ